MWHKFCMWLWGEPPLTFWAVCFVDSSDETACYTNWVPIQILGWHPNYSKGWNNGQGRGHCGPFPELADAERFCAKLNS